MNRETVWRFSLQTAAVTRWVGHCIAFVMGTSFSIKICEVECRIGICYSRDSFFAAKREEKNAMEPEVEARENYMRNLKRWLQETEDSPLEEMSDFFANRLDGYEEHMSVWEKSYRIFAETLPSGCRKILDLGCGTGLELDRIWQKNPHLEVTGIDLCRNMLDKLLEKHSDKHITTVCQDYFRYDFGQDKWDAVISFESLHHFLPERKKILYRRVCDGLKKGGLFMTGDYIACCDEEEALLQEVYRKKREQSVIPDHCFVHFDIPLTLEHETGLLEDAGFVIEKIWDEPGEATIITARKG